MQVAHRVPMLSIENVYDEEGVKKFDADVRKGLGKGTQPEYCLEFKIDGVDHLILRHSDILAIVEREAAAAKAADPTATSAEALGEAQSDKTLATE